MVAGLEKQDEYNNHLFIVSQMIKSQCRICRRVGEKLFLKGERCFSQKCEMVKKPYPPGPKGKRRKAPLSEYGKEHREVQKIKSFYGLPGKQLRKYVKEILSKRRVAGSSRKGSEELSEDASSLLVRKAESRLDNAVFKLGLTGSRGQARSLVSHGHFLVNGKRVKIPSYILRKGDIVSVRPGSSKKTFFQKTSSLIKKYNPPSWLTLDAEKLEGKVTGVPTLEEAGLPIEIPAIFEFYSR